MPQWPTGTPQDQQPEYIKEYHEFPNGNGIGTTSNPFFQTIFKALPDPDSTSLTLIGMFTLCLLPWLLFSATSIRKRIMSKSKSANGVALCPNEPNDHETLLLNANENEVIQPRETMEITQLDGDTRTP